jgi:hypothetical protein
MSILDRSLLWQHSRAFVICYHIYRKYDSETFLLTYKDGFSFRMSDNAPSYIFPFIHNFKKCVSLALFVCTFKNTGRIYYKNLPSIIKHLGARASAVGWGTALQAGRSRVRFPMVSLDFFHWHDSSGRIMTLGLTQSLTEINTRSVFWG